MISMKRTSRLGKTKKRISTIEYVVVLSLFSVVIMGALAAAATKTTAGYVFLSNAIHMLFG